MKKIFTERNIVVVLFIAAFVVFSFAQEDAKKIERMKGVVVVTNPSIISSPRQTAELSTINNAASVAVK
ncbi:hypothetical protein [Terrimonas alba]|uniref:hypothetical protein n=1 Tax=Terrimonas alba TaxID=3349636 RepID=UPI0035F48214